MITTEMEMTDQELTTPDVEMATTEMETTDQDLFITVVKTTTTEMETTDQDSGPWLAAASPLAVSG